MLAQWTEVMKQEKRRRYGLMMKAVVFHRRLVYGLHVYVYIYSQIQQNIVSERALILFADF